LIAEEMIKFISEASISSPKKRFEAKPIILDPTERVVRRKGSTWCVEDEEPIDMHSFCEGIEWTYELGIKR